MCLGVRDRERPDREHAADLPAQARLGGARKGFRFPAARRNAVRWQVMAAIAACLHADTEHPSTGTQQICRRGDVRTSAGDIRALAVRRRHLSAPAHRLQSCAWIMPVSGIAASVRLDGASRVPPYLD